MLEIEQEKTEQRKKDLETLAVKKQADALFARNEEEKRKGKFDNSRHLMNFHLSQVVSVVIQSCVSILKIK